MKVVDLEHRFLFESLNCSPIIEVPSVIAQEVVLFIFFTFHSVHQVP
ncbi:hypothetical protein Hanom_Chr08g00754541 [Helianthus anomalus]